MTRYSLPLIAAAMILATVSVAQARPVRGATTVTVTAGKPSEFKFVLSTKTVPHGTVTFKYTNKGKLPHDFSICTKPTTTPANACASKGTAAIAPGSSATLKFTFAKAGTYEYICKVPGHAAAGMKGLIKVT